METINSRVNIIKDSVRYENKTEKVCENSRDYYKWVKKFGKRARICFGILSLGISEAFMDEKVWDYKIITRTFQKKTKRNNKKP